MELAMTVLVLEKVPASVRGELSKWMVEVQAGVFVGTISALVRDKLWALITSKAKEGAGLLVYSSDNEQGFAFLLAGTSSRVPEDFEGVKLMRIP
jgi:CRISPR-associated protein Cas2